MIPPHFVLVRSAFLPLIVVAALVPPLGAQPAPQGVSLSVSQETAPPGGMAQIKVFITEPMPISTGSGLFAFSAYDSIDGIALMNELEDVAGIALVQGTNMSFAFTSPSATFGMNSDYPVMAVAGRIPADSAVGVKYPFTIDAASLQLMDPSGAPYAIDAKPGHLITAAGLSIHDVNPGSAIVPAGTVVTISGSGFVPRTEIRFKEYKLSQVRYISATRIDVVVAQPTEMHGVAIKATNPDGSRSFYFSYQRTRRQGAPSVDDVLKDAVPLIPPRGVRTASLAFPAAAANTTYGVALQNIETAEATVTLALVDPNGLAIATAETLTLSPNRFVVHELSELFGFAPGTAATVRITSTVPVQVLGAIATQPTGNQPGTATPVTAF